MSLPRALLGARDDGRVVDDGGTEPLHQLIALFDATSQLTRRWDRTGTVGHDQVLDPEELRDYQRILRAMALKGRPLAAATCP